MTRRKSFAGRVKARRGSASGRGTSPSPGTTRRPPASGAPLHDIETGSTRRPRAKREQPEINEAASGEAGSTPPNSNIEHPTSAGSRTNDARPAAKGRQPGAKVQRDPDPGFV